MKWLKCILLFFNGIASPTCWLSNVLNDWGIRVRHPSGTKDFPVHSVQTACSETYPADTGGKETEGWIWPLTSSRGDFMNDWSYASTLTCRVFMPWCRNKYRENFSLLFSTRIFSGVKPCPCVGTHIRAIWVCPSAPYNILYVNKLPKTQTEVPPWSYAGATSCRRPAGRDTSYQQVLSTFPSECMRWEHQ
jgi:hypothetical protein